MAEDLVVSLRADISQFQRELSRAERSTRDAADTIQRQTSQASRGFQSLAAGVRVFSGAIAGLGIARIGQDLIQTGLRAESLSNAFRAITGSTQAATRELTFVREQAQRLGVANLATAESFKGLSAAAQGTSIEGEATRKVFVGLLEASTVLGLSSDQTSGALTALEQIISKGKLSAEELRQQLGERLPGAFRLAADALGKTTAELEDLLSKGLIPAEEFIQAFGRALTERFGKDAVQASDSARASFNRLSNAINDLKLSIVEAGFLDAVSDAAKQLTALVGVVDRSTDAIGRAIKVFGLLSGFRFPSLATAFGTDADALRKQIELIGDLDQKIKDTKETIEELQGLTGGREQFALGLEEERLKNLQADLAKAVTELKNMQGATDAAGDAADNATPKLSTLGATGVKAFGETAKAADLALSRIETFAEASTDEIIESFEEQRQARRDAFGAEEEIQRFRDELLRDEIDSQERTTEQVLRIRRDAIGEQLREEERAGRERERELDRQQRAAERAFDRFATGVENSLADVFERSLRGGFDFFETLEDLAIESLSRIAASFARQTLFGGGPGGGGGGGLLGGLLGGIFSGGAGGGAGAGFGGGSPAPVGAGAGAAAAGAVVPGGFLSSVLGGGLLGAGGPGVFSGLVPAAGSPLAFLGTGIGPATLGTFLGGAGLGIGGGLISSQILGQLGLSGTGNNVLSGALGGAAAGSFVFPGIGTALGAGAGALGGFISSLLGGGRGDPTVAVRTDPFGAPQSRFEDQFIRPSPFGVVGLDDATSRNLGGTITQDITDFIVEIDRATARLLDDRQEAIAQRILTATPVGSQFEFEEFDEVATSIVAQRLQKIVTGISPESFRGATTDLFADIDQTVNNLPAVDQRLRATLEAFDLAEVLGKTFEGLDVDRIIQGAGSIQEVFLDLQNAGSSLDIIAAAGEQLTSQQRELAADVLSQSGALFASFDGDVAEFVANRLQGILEAISPADLEFLSRDLFGEIAVVERNIPLLQSRFTDLVSFFRAAGVFAETFEDVDLSQVIKSGTSLRDAFLTLETVANDLTFRAEASRSIEAQIESLLLSQGTEAVQFEARLDRADELRRQLTSGEGDPTQLIPQIQAIAGQIFRDALSEDVLGQDPERLSFLQGQVVQVLEGLQLFLSKLPSFQGLQDPLTFTRPTLAAIHQGETLLPAGGGGFGGVLVESGAIVVNASSGQNPGAIADAIVREIESRGRFSQTRIRTAGRTF